MPDINNITFGYIPERNIFRNFSLFVPLSGRIWLSGSSGSGKTTLLRLIMGLEKPQRGVVTGFESLRFSAVFQENRLIPHKTALQNVEMFSDENSACSMLSELGLADSIHQIPADLSGGMKRRVALARALCHSCDVLVLDEPFTGLDEAVKQQCFQAINRVSEGKMLILTTHDPSDAQALHTQRVDLACHSLKGETL